MCAHQYEIERKLINVNDYYWIQSKGFSTVYTQKRAKWGAEKYVSMKVHAQKGWKLGLQKVRFEEGIPAKRCKKGRIKLCKIPF